MAGLRRVRPVRKRFTRFTPRASSAKSICDGSQREARQLFPTSPHGACQRQRPASRRKVSFMSSPAYSNRRFDAAVPDALTDLALDLRWSFNHSADQLWERLDAELWESTNNPWVA